MPANSWLNNRTRDANPLEAPTMRTEPEPPPRVAPATDLSATADELALERVRMRSSLAVTNGMTADAIDASCRVHGAGPGEFCFGSPASRVHGLCMARFVRGDRLDERIRTRTHGGAR
jgi:hypothetical protein